MNQYLPVPPRWPDRAETYLSRQFAVLLIVLLFTISWCWEILAG